MLTSVASSQVPAARNTLRILSLLSTIDVPISAARIQRELSLPRSTTYHLLAEMIAGGFVVHIKETQTYGLGMAAYAMANAYAKQQPLVRMTTAALTRVAETVNGSGHISRLSGSEIVYLQEVRSSGAVSLITDVGVRLPAPTTASGKILLAYLPTVEAKAAFSTSGAKKNWKQFDRELSIARERGFSEEIGEVTRGQHSVAVAVFDHLSRPAAALAVTFMGNRVTEAQRTAAVEQLKEIAVAAGNRIYGGSP